jgi:hypothetical protein
MTQQVRHDVAIVLPPDVDAAQFQLLFELIVLILRMGVPLSAIRNRLLGLKD